jgi:hypothetical protein
VFGTTIGERGCSVQPTGGVNATDSPWFQTASLRVLPPVGVYDGERVSEPAPVESVAVELATRSPRLIPASSLAP